MESNQGYLSRAWHDLTQDPKWWQPILILSLVSCIPIVGGLFVAGYLLDWGREGAWGMTRGITRKVGDATKRLKWGFFAVVISICWTLPVSIIGNILSAMPVLGIILYIASYVCTLILGVIAMGANIRMTIYDRIGAGLQFKRIWNMARKDAGGLARCFCISLLEVVPVIVMVIIILIACGPVLIASGTGAYMGTSMSYVDNTAALVTALIGGGLLITLIVFVLCFVALVAYTTCEALAYRAYGYWIAQFEPAKWNGMDDPMPFEPGYVARQAPVPPQADDAANTESGFEKTVDAAAAAVAAAGATAAAAAQKAAASAAQAAQGFKTEAVNSDDTAAQEAAEPAVVEAEVVGVQDVSADAAPASDAQTAGEKLAAVYREAYDKTHGEQSAEAEPAADEPAADADEQKPSFCPQCGKPVEGSPNFCANCGSKLQ